LELAPDERQQGQETGAFHRFREFPLMLGAGAGVLGVDYLGLARDEAAQKTDLFIIDILEVLRTKKALLIHGCDFSFRMAGLPLLSLLRRGR